MKKKITKLKSPIVVGLDPKLSEIPDCYKDRLEKKVRTNLKRFLK